MGLFRKLTAPLKRGVLGKITSVGRTLSPGVPSAILPGGDPTDLFKFRPPSAQITHERQEQLGRVAEDTVNLATYGPLVASAYTGGASMSIWSSVLNVAGQLGSQYLASRAARNVPPPVVISGPSSFPSMPTTPVIGPGLGMLPQLGRALPMIGGAVAGGVGLAARGARAIARSANAYCTKHPAWCASVGGISGVAGLIESGQLPAVRRRRGRGITPRDLRSFRRVANLVRGYCPTVRRIPSRKLGKRS